MFANQILLSNLRIKYAVNIANKLMVSMGNKF